MRVRVHRLNFLIAVALVALCSNGCEDVVTVDLNAVEPRLVIEVQAQMLSHNIDSYRIHIEHGTFHRTTDYYNPSLPDKIEFPHIEVWPQFHIKPGDTLVAMVTVEGLTYTAMATMPTPIQIDSLTFTYQEGGGLGLEEEEGYRLHVHFNDPPDDETYVRLNVWRNEDRFADYNLYDGRFSDGNAIDYDFFFDTFQPGDIAYVELVTMDETVYDYFNTFREIITGEDGTNPFDITPANPNTNWSGDALGYFGVFSEDIASVQLGESVTKIGQPVRFRRDEIAPASR